MAKNLKQQWAVLLLADGFDEVNVVSLAKEFRLNGLPVQLVGLKADACSSNHGLQLLPDATIESLNDLSIGMVILPAGRDAAFRLRSDPRIRRLLQAAMADKKPIALSLDSFQLFRRAGFLLAGLGSSRETDEALLVQAPGQDDSEFARLSRRMYTQRVAPVNKESHDDITLPDSHNLNGMRSALSGASGIQSAIVAG